MEDIIGASEEQVSESSTVRKKEQILSYLRRNRVGHEYLVDSAARQAIASEIGCNHEYVRQALKTLAKQGKINCTVRKRGQGQAITFPEQIDVPSGPPAIAKKEPKKTSVGKKSDLTLLEIEERLRGEIHEMEIALEAKKNTLATVLKLRKELK